jgi:hypothetical protein
MSFLRFNEAGSPKEKQKIKWGSIIPPAHLLWYIVFIVYDTHTYVETYFLVLHHSFTTADYYNQYPYILA